MSTRMSQSKTEKSYSWCPECKKWIPSKYFMAEYDDVDKVLVRMCNHCAAVLGDEDLPQFDWDSCIYDPNHETVKCPFCGQHRRDHIELNCRATPKDSDYHRWRCGNPNCGKQFKLIY